MKNIVDLGIARKSEAAVPNLIAALFEDGTYNYICAGYFGSSPRRNDGSFVSLSEFGIQPEAIIKSDALFRKTAQSRAEHETGEPRHWQGESSPFIVLIAPEMLPALTRYINGKYSSLSTTTPDPEYDMGNELMAIYSKPRALYSVIDPDGVELFTFPGHFSKEVAIHMGWLWTRAFKQGEKYGEETYKIRAAKILRDLFGVGK